MKKVSIILCALLLALCCIFLIACDPDGSNFDKASQNKEFVSFRKKIVTILKDNDIFVNDLDKSAAKSGGGSEYAQATSLYADGGKSAIDKVAEIMMKDGYKSNEDYDFALKQIYTIALQMSICVGDGMLNYFDEKEFFNIPVYFPDMDIVITENGNKTCMYGYQKTSDNVEHIQKIEVVFNAENDYCFTVTEPTGDWMVTGDTADSVYFYGDSNKRFLMLRSGYEAIYASNGEDFYQTTDKKTLEDCLDALGSDVFEYDVAEYRKIKDNVKHTFSSGQASALMDKYFKDVQSSTENRPSEFMYENFGGKNVLIGYYAGEGESEVVIPSNVKYIYERFSIEDIQGSVKTLTVPASVTAIIDDNGNTQTDASYVNFALHKQEGEALLQNITVAQGSPLFKSGSGHLRLKNGVCIYAVDKAGESLDWDVLMRARMQSNGDVQYRNIFTVNSDAFRVSNADITRLEREYEIPEDEVMQTMQKVMSSSQFTKYDISVSCADADLPGGDPNEGAFAVLSLAIELKSDVTINVTYDKMQPQDSAHCLVDLTNKSQTVRNVTVNTAGFAYQTYLCVRPAQPSADKGEEPQFVPNDKIQTAFNLDVSQLYYDGLCYGRLIRDVQNSQVNFDKKQDAEYLYFKITNANTNPNHSELYCDVGITGNVRDGENITVPSKLFGLPVRRVDLDVSALTGKNVTIALPNLDETDLQVDFYNSDENQDVVLKNDGVVITCPNGMQKLVSGMSTHDSDGNYAISITLQADGKTQSFQTGWEYGSGNPDNEVKSFRLYDSDEDYQSRAVEYSVANGAVLLQSANADCAYFAYPEELLNDGVIEENCKPLTLFVDGLGRLCAEVADIKQDAYYRLATRPLGKQTVSARGNMTRLDFEAEVTVAAEQRQGRTYFRAYIEELIPSFPAGNEQDAITYGKYQSVLNATFFDWLDISYTVTEREFDPDDYETVTDEFSYPGGRKILMVLRNGDILVKEKDEYSIFEITVDVDGQTFKSAARIGREGSPCFDVEDWNLQDVDKYRFFVLYTGGGRDMWFNVAFERMDGRLCAVFEGRPPRQFALKRLLLGSREYRMTGDNYDLTLSVNVVKPAWADGYPDVKNMDFSKSSIAIQGTVEDRPVHGDSSLNYKPGLYYQDVEYGVCNYNLFYADGKATFELLDEYVTINVTVGANSYDKRIVKGDMWEVDATEFVSTADEYYYFWIIDGTMEWGVTFIENKIQTYYDKEVNFKRYVLARLAKGETTFRLQSDEENASYDLSVTVTVAFDDGHEPILCVKSVSAEGTYKGRQITYSEGRSVSVMEYRLDDLPYLYDMRFNLDVDGMECKIVSVNEKSK